MQTVLSLLRSRAAWLLFLAGLGLTQAGCAHPVWVEPSVGVHAHMGGPVYGSIHAPVYVPPPVMVSPPPVWAAPAPVRIAPRHWGPPGHHHHHRGRHGHGERHGWGHR